MHVTSDVQAAEAPGTRLSHWQALVSIVDRPRSTLQAIGEQPRYRWLLPFILMIAGIVCLSVVTTSYTPQGAGRQMQRQGAAVSPPQTEEAQPSGQTGAARSQGQMFANPILRQVIPPAARLLTGLLSWVLFAGALYVIGLAVGGKAGYGQLFAVVSWSWIPYILGDFFQAGYILATGRLIRLPGLSFLAATGNGTANLLHLALAQVDIFLLWHLLLIGLGIAALNHFGRGKTLLIVLVYLLIVIGVALIPALIGPVVPGGFVSPMRGVRVR
jgi:hypothetical protein